VGIGEVLPLQAGLRQLLLHGLDEKVYEFVVGIARDALVPPTEVLWCLQSVLVVRSHVKHDRQGSGRVNAADQRNREKVCQSVSPCLPRLDRRFPGFARRPSPQ
jgi:hypothetical protein